MIWSLTLSPAAEKSLERIADALDRLAPPPLPLSGRQKQLNIEDLLVTDDERLADFEAEEYRKFAIETE
jgi:hypothetical protein